MKYIYLPLLPLPLDGGREGRLSAKQKRMLLIHQRTIHSSSQLLLLKKSSLFSLFHAFYFKKKVLRVFNNRRIKIIPSDFLCRLWLLFPGLPAAAVSLPSTFSSFFILPFLPQYSSLNHPQTLGSRDPQIGFLIFLSPSLPSKPTTIQLPLFFTFSFMDGLPPYYHPYT